MMRLRQLPLAALTMCAIAAVAEAAAPAAGPSFE
jgi:hypothetical protein